MEYKLTINGRLDGLNDYTSANRTNPYKGAKMKADNEAIVICAIRNQLKKAKITKPVIMQYCFYERNQKRDLDNISSFAHKVIQDSLVKTGVIKNDGWKDIVGMSDQFLVDKEHPRIELVISEVV